MPFHERSLTRRARRAPVSRTLSRGAIEEIEAFESRYARVLSLYLGLEPRRQVKGSYRAVFEDLVKETRASLDETTREVLEKETRLVGEWIEGHRPGGKGLAVFSSSADQFWRAYFLPVCVEDHMAFEPRPDVAPLFDVVDEYERYVVALVDKEKARLFAVFVGQIEELDMLEDEVPPRTDQGGLSQSHFQRHHELHVLWHLKRVVDHLARLFGRRKFDRLILAGHEEATSELRRLLPRALAHRLIARIPADTSAGEAEILAHTLEVERRVEREAEGRILTELLETAGAGGRATLGVPRTLDALWQGAVQTLIVAHGAGPAGSECINCGRLDVGTVATCPACAHPMRPTHDVFHRAMGRTMEHAGSVEVMHEEAAQRLQQDGGGMGAMLRYVASPVPVGS